MTSIGLETGATDKGSPDLRRHYHRSYQAAFVLDPDGQNLERHWPRPEAARAAMAHEGTASAQATSVTLTILDEGKVMGILDVLKKKLGGQETSASVDVDLRLVCSKALSIAYFDFVGTDSIAEMTSTKIRWTISEFLKNALSQSPDGAVQLGEVLRAGAAVLVAAPTGSDSQRERFVRACTVLANDVGSETDAGKLLAVLGAQPYE